MAVKIKPPIIHEPNTATSYDKPAEERLKRFKSNNFFQQMKKNLAVFIFFFQYLKPYKSKAFIIVVSKFFGAPLAVIGAIVAKYIIDDILLNDFLPIEEKIRQFIICIIIQVLLWLITLLQRELIFGMIEWYLDLRITVDIMRDFYTHEQSLDLKFHRSRAIGEHMYRTSEDLINDIGYQRGGLLGMITTDWVEAITIIWEISLASAFFFLLDPTLGIIVFAYLIPKLFSIHKLNTWYKDINYQNREIQQERFAVERDLIYGMKTFKSLGKTRFAANRFGQIMNYVQRIYYKWTFAQQIGEQGVIWFFKEILYNRGIHLYVFFSVMNGTMTVGSLVLVQTLVGRITRPLENLILLIQRFRQRLVPAERMVETLNVKPSITDKPEAVRIKKVTGQVDFQNVTFGYTSDNILLKNVSFTIRPGERVGFVGPSGAGKSTIFNLILRLYDPMEGKVLVDGNDLCNIRLKSFLDRIGVILQETFLFSGTIKDNILYGNPFAKEDEIRKVLELAELGKYISEAPDGLDTFLGEGTKISGGQKQRIGIARALIRNPSMFIMDEPTAHLDVIAEMNVFKTIENITKGKTTLIISHRIAPILFVDRLLVLTPGGVEAMGTHAELLQISPTYQALWKVQQGEVQA